MFRILLSTALLSACYRAAPEKAIEDTGELPVTGQLSIRYSIDSDLIDGMEEPARGVFYGEIFDAEDVTALGPDPGAEALDGIEHALDLGDGTVPTELLYTSIPLQNTKVVIVGFLDSDENAGDLGMSQDAGDPIALPEDNEFDVVMERSTAVTVHLGMLHPSR